MPYGSNRENVTVYVSYDEGQTWPVSKCIVPYASAYSSLCVLPDGTIGLYVEEKQEGATGYSTVFYNFSLEWLTDGEDVWIPASVTDHVLSSDVLTVYPVPATSVIRIEANGLKTVQLYNMNGQQIKMLDIEGDSMIDIDVSDLAPGMYLIEGMDDHGVRKMGKFIK